jgi:hypothetical protein
MHRILAQRAAVTALAVLLTATGVAAQQPTKLTPTEIQSTFFNGQPFTASTTSNIKFKMTFLTDGKMKREPLSGGNKGEGNWKLSKDGFCTTWAGSTLSNCFTLVAAGTNKWSVMKGSTLQAIWTK